MEKNNCDIMEKNNCDKIYEDLHNKLKYYMIFSKNNCLTNSCKRKKELLYGELNDTLFNLLYCYDIQKYN
tara:strand:+ start:155 stop:364 length:210 start_codon:yes stop_codon:yes gene_type:complete